MSQAGGALLTGLLSGVAPVAIAQNTSTPPGSVWHVRPDTVHGKLGLSELEPDL